MNNKPETLELTNGALLELYRDSIGKEYAQIIARKRKSRWYEWREITPRLNAIEDCVLPNDYVVGLLAFNIKKESAYKNFRSSELSRLAWKISRAGFRYTARRLSLALQEPLNGYPIVPETPEQGFLFVADSKSDPVFISGDLPCENRWDFKLRRGLSAESQESLLDDIALATIHDFNLRELLRKKKYERLEIEAAERRKLHRSNERPLRQWTTSSGFRHHFAVNRNLKKEWLTYSLVLKVHAGNALTGAGKKGVLNNYMVSVADELADSFDGVYKIEGIEAYFELATDLVRFSQKLKRRRLGSLTDSQVYLNITKDFKWAYRE